MLQNEKNFIFASHLVCLALKLNLFFCWNLKFISFKLIFLVFLDYFNVLMLKINFKKYKINIIF